MKKIILMIICFLIGSNKCVFATDYPQTIDEIRMQRDNGLKAVDKFEIEEGKWTVGEDIPPGRYKITHVEGYSVKFYLFNGKYDHDPYFNFEFNNEKIKEASIDVSAGEIVETYGYGKLIFSPQTPKEVTSISTMTIGNWVVGIDLAPGVYQLSSEENAVKMIYIYSVGKYPEGKFEYYQNVGKDKNYTKYEKVQIKLTEGQVILNPSISKIILEKE